tara:strand:- start:1093 stop:1395 length:303 start_codon:yes stop_codon:yes gene_type:complete
MKKGNKMSIEECLLDTGKSVETKMRMMTDFEKNCYGISEETIRKEYMNSLTAKFSGLEMVVMGILSDVQEDPTLNTRCRKQLNVAKFILSEMMEEKREVA